MKSNCSMKLCLSLAVAALSVTTVDAQNPIIQSKYTADPAPMVYNDTVYLYVDHDEDQDIGFFTMKNWLMYKSTDMVNWTDCGEVASLKTFTWGAQDNGAWAAQCVQRNGKFYFYCTIPDKGIAVATSDTPYGPFTDARGKALVKHSSGDIDPTVFIDDDNQAYLYWGNPGLYYVKLRDDMIHYSGKVVEIAQDSASFGGPKDNATYDDVKSGKYKDLYEEGPWFMKRNNLYYMLFAAGGVPEHLAYSTSDSPTGPWKYRGVIMPTQGGSFTNHCGVIDFKGNSYLFYHNAALKGGSGIKRSVCVEQFSYHDDGTIPTINMTTTGVKEAVSMLNPYQRVEAETMANEQGIETNRDEQKGMFVDSISDGDYIKVRSVDFGSKGAAMFTAHVASTSTESSIEVRLDSRTGTLVGTLPISYSAGEWKDEHTVMNSCTGIHDVFFVFKGKTDNSTLFKFDHWMMTRKNDDHIVIGVNVY